MTNRILQIIPADGWYATFAGSDGETMFDPLVCWALVEDEHGEQRVVGIDGDGDGVTDFSDAVDNFAGYVLLGDASKHLEQQAATEQHNTGMHRNAPENLKIPDSGT